MAAPKGRWRPDRATTSVASFARGFVLLLVLVIAIGLDAFVLDSSRRACFAGARRLVLAGFLGFFS
jgi:hypothetical protein